MARPISGLPVSYVADTPATCSVAAGILTAVAPGPCSVTASQPGDATFAPADNVQATTTIEPQPPDPVAQTITFALPSSTLVGSSLVLGGTADSGLPVGYASTTPLVCSVSDITLTALAVGTCTVTASQPGDDAYLPAPAVQASMAVEAVPAGVDLGKYAVNGPVRDVVIEPGTGRTILGGDFTQIGVRTGPVAVVEPPDLGTGKLKAREPRGPRDRSLRVRGRPPERPGLLHRRPAHRGERHARPAVTGDAPAPQRHRHSLGGRYRLDGHRGRRHLPGPGGLRHVDRHRRRARRRGQHLSGQSTGLSFVDRDTGECTASLPNVDQPLPDLDACAGQDYCHATVNRLDWDAASNSLYVAYITWVGTLSNNVETTWYLTRYNLASGGWAWTKVLQAEPGGGTVQGGFVTGMVVFDGRVLVRGTFPLDPGGSDDDRSHLLSVNAATGAIVQRWNQFGEQELVGGDTSGPADDCFTNEIPRGELFDFQGDAGHWIGRDPELCHFTVSGGLVSGAPVPGVDLLDAQAFAAPTVEYEDGSGDDYLLSPWMAIALPSGDIVDWHPDPSTEHASTTLAVSSAGVAVAGNFQFVRGTSSPGVVALTASLSPDPSFESPLFADPPPTVRALALHDGWLIVGGQFFVPADPGPKDAASLVALDPQTGAFEAWSPDVDEPGLVETIAPDPATG